MGAAGQPLRQGDETSGSEPDACGARARQAPWPLRNRACEWPPAGQPVDRGPHHSGPFQDCGRGKAARQPQAAPWLPLRRSRSTFDSQMSSSGKRNPLRATCSPSSACPPDCLCRRLRRLRSTPPRFHTEDDCRHCGCHGDASTPRHRAIRPFPQDRNNYSPSPTTFPARFPTSGSCRRHSLGHLAQWPSCRAQDRHRQTVDVARLPTAHCDKATQAVPATAF